MHAPELQWVGEESLGATPWTAPAPTPPGQALLCVWIWELGRFLQISTSKGPS